MFRSFVITSALLLAPSAGLSQVPPANPANSAPAPALTVLQPQEARQDFDLLRRSLEEGHPGLYRYSTKADLDREFDALRARIESPISTADFEAIVAEALTGIRCGHTSLTPDPQLESAMRSARTFPLRVVVQGSGLVVMLNDTPSNAAIVPGMQLLEINGRKVTDILERFWPCLSADGDIQTGKRHDITGRFAHYYWWLIDRTDHFTIKARGDSGAIVSATLDGVTDADRKTNQNPVNTRVVAAVGKLLRWGHGDPAFRFIDDPDIAELRLNYFLGNSFPSDLESAFKTLREKKTRALIIDLRGNGGGADEYGALLVSYLTDKRFRYFDQIRIKTLEPSFSAQMDGFNSLKDKLATGQVTRDPGGDFVSTPKLHPGLSTQQPSKFPFTGKLFVLTDGGTFSTAADFCAVLHSLGRATFIGEETGGAYHGNNSGPMPTLTLPHSKAGIRFPMYAYYNAVPANQFQRRGTIPDHPVEMKISDLMNGIDAPLDRAVELSRKATASGR